jgi:predicted TIM-barrel fold metal-dependent hydrolase
MIRRRSDGREFYVLSCHAHAGESSMLERFFLYAKRGHRFLVEETVSHIEHFGLDATVLFPMTDPISNYAETNVKIIDGSRRFADRIIPFARINPNYDGAAESVSRYVAQGVRGLKLHPFWDGFAANDPILVRPIMEEADRFGLVCLFHSGDAWTALPGLIWDLAMDFKNVKFIIGHSGFYGFDTEARAIARRMDNVWCDTTMLGPPTRIKTMVHLVGKDKVLFGTDSPYLNPGAELESVLRFSELTDDELEAVLATNLAEMLDLKLTREVYRDNIVEYPLEEPIFWYDEAWVREARATDSEAGTEAP